LFGGCGVCGGGGGWVGGGGVGGGGGGGEKGGGGGGGGGGGQSQVSSPRAQAARVCAHASAVWAVANGNVLDACVPIENSHLKALAALVCFVQMKGVGCALVLAK